MINSELTKELAQKFSIINNYDPERIVPLLQFVMHTYFEAKVIENGIFRDAEESEDFYHVIMGQSECMDQTVMEQIKRDRRFFIRSIFVELTDTCEWVHSEEELEKWLNRFNEFLTKHKIVKDVNELAGYYVQLDREFDAVIESNKEMRSEYQLMYEGERRQVQ